MEFDTASAYLVIPLSVLCVYEEIFQKQKLQRISVTIQTYTGEPLFPVGNNV